MRLRSLLLMSCFFTFDCFAETIYISNFSDQSLAGWKSKSFKEETQYQIISLKNQEVLKADSKGVASSLYKEVKIDLQKTPYLNWSWRIDKKLTIRNEQSKQGDDFSARIYLIVKGEWFFWQTKAINYVWASQTPKNKSWANPFTGNSVMMIAVRSNTDLIEHWYSEKRNVLTDFQLHFGNDIRYIDGIAIMTDTDNANGSALSYYTNIYFTEQ